MRSQNVLALNTEHGKDEDEDDGDDDDDVVDGWFWTPSSE
jgi:hypothetical protein